jgi:hypothetical protein
MPEAPQPDDNLDGIATDLTEAAAAVRDELRWVGAHLREMLSAFGIARVDGSDPDDT